MFGWYSVQSVKNLRIWRDYPFKRKKVSFLERRQIYLYVTFFVRSGLQLPFLTGLGGGGGEFSSRDPNFRYRGEGEFNCFNTNIRTREFYPKKGNKYVSDYANSRFMTKQNTYWQVWGHGTSIRTFSTPISWHLLSLRAQ